MEVIWHILLTTCLHTSCVTQDVQWFDDEPTCKMMLRVYQDIPPDGDWTSISWVCKPKGSIEA